MCMFGNIIWNKNKDQKPEVYGGRNFMMWKLRTLGVTLRSLKLFLSPTLQVYQVVSCEDSEGWYLSNNQTFKCFLQYCLGIRNNPISCFIRPNPWVTSLKQIPSRVFSASFNLEESGKIKNGYLSNMGIRHFSRSSRKISL